MKTWISNWKASANLDSEHPVCGMHREGEIQEIHDRLRSSRPEADAPEDLHFSIMQRVRRERTSAAERTPSDGRGLIILRWAGAAGAACVIALWLSLSGTKGPAPAGISANSLSEKAAESLQVVGALDKELDHLDQDLRAAAEHLIASVP